MPLDLLEYMEFFESRGVGVISASAVGMGLLTGGDIPPWHPASSFTKEACKEAAALCKKYNKSIGILFINLQSLLSIEI